MELKKIKGIRHCRYCESETYNKNRICKKCICTKVCRRCKNRLLLENFKEGKLICIECINKEVQKKKKGIEVSVECEKCGKKEVVFRRYRNKPKIYTCESCLGLDDVVGKKNKMCFL